MSSGSLLGRVYKMLPGMEDAEPHPIVADFAVAIAVNVDEQEMEMETIAIAMTLTDDIAVDALKSLPSKAEILEPDFTVDEPLTAVGQIATEDGNVIKLAKLSRDDAFYLVGTSADATELAKFAVNPAVAEAKTPDNVYAVVKIGGEYLSENGLPAAPDFKAEIGLSSTESPESVESAESPESIESPESAESPE